MISIAEKYQNQLADYQFIDLFAGIGGFHLALQSFGAKGVFASEWDKYAAATYFENFEISPKGDITKIDEKEIPTHDILCGGFPCQAFSISGKQKGFEDTRGTLFFDIARIVSHHKPSILLLENVKNLLRHDEGKTLKTIVQTLENLDYHVWSHSRRISSGQKQRIAIARAIYNAKDILIFDEATNALDLETEQKIISNIFQLKNKHTIILVSHEMRNLEGCDVIYKVKNGKIELNIK